MIIQGKQPALVFRIRHKQIEEKKRYLDVRRGVKKHLIEVTSTALGDNTKTQLLFLTGVFYPQIINVKNVCVVRKTVAVERQALFSRKWRKDLGPREQHT